ncbi:MAG TPA: two-component regulator propeller domain-containing protein, partial [Chitinophagales bacterium]|nr:two-component regulator propeller domain-containing protein [Chitinophagales bacterium]
MKLLRIAFMLLCSGCVHLLFSQQLRFETFNTRSGLSSNEVTCIYEDHSHFLWVGTKDGLNCFDGRVFRVFRSNPADTNSLSGNYIVGITQDKEHVFWIATKDGGLTRYDANASAGKQFRQFKNDPGNKKSIATNRLNCVANWDDTYMAIGAEVVPGIFLNKKTLQFSYWNYNETDFHPRNALSSPLGRQTWIHSMQDAGDKFYFSLLHSGLVFVVNKATGSSYVMHAETSVTRFFTEDNSMWMIGWGSTLVMQDIKPDSKPEAISGFNDELTCVVNVNRSYVLVGSRGSGLFLVNKKSHELTTFKRNVVDPSSIPSNRINAAFKDSRGIIWVGTARGLAKYDSKTWLFTETEFTDVQYDGNTFYTYRFADGSVAVNTNKGTFLSDEYLMSFKNLRFHAKDWDVIPDCLLPLDASDFLMGTESGFYRWQKGSSKLRELNIPEFPEIYGSSVYQIKEMIFDDVQGKHGVWLAVLGYGLAYYSFDDEKYYKHANDVKDTKTIGSNLTRRIDRDAKGNIWIATASGLYRRDPKTALDKNVYEKFLNKPGDPNTLPSNDVTDVWCSRDNHVFVTMGGAGLAEFDGQKFTQYVPENPVSSRIFLGMHIDHRNRIWIITKNGLEVFDRATKKFFHLDVNDGSANTSLSSYFSNETDGIVSFTAGNKLYSFKPDKIDFSTSYPPLYLTDMNVFGKSFWTDVMRGTTHLNSSERYVNFAVSALQFTSPQMVRFQYKLDGMEEAWSNSEDGNIKYTNLPWGHYKLMVRVTNPAGQFGGERKLAEFVIATPFYYTWWFIAICMAVMAAIGYAFYRYRISQLMKLQAMRNKIARDLHDDIGSTLGSISVFSEAAKQLLQQEKTERAQNMLLKIGDTSREMIENMSDIVWSVNPKNDAA